MNGAFMDRTQHYLQQGGDIVLGWLLWPAALSQLALLAVAPSRRK